MPSSYPTRQTALVVAAILALSFAIYANSLSVPFIFDDLTDIKNNPAIRIESLSPSALWDAGFQSPAPARFVVYISFALNHYFHGDAVAGYHVVNIAVHAITAVLLFWLIRLTLATPALAGTVRHGDWLAAAAALVWLVNPIQTQSVTYIVQRMNAMAALFYLLALVLYAKGRLEQFKIQNSKFKMMDKGSRFTVHGSRLKEPKAQTPKPPSTQPPKHYFYFAAALVSGLLALGCKQNAATLPLAAFVYEWYFFRDLDRSWLAKQTKWIAVVVAGVALLGLTFVATNPVRLDQLTDFDQGEFTMGQRVLTQLRVVLHYLGLFLFPHPSRLTLDYQYRLSNSLLDPPTTLLALGTIAALLVWAGAGARRHRLLSFCVVWYFLHLAIESTVIPLAVIFEHRAYLPTMGPALAIAFLGRRLLRPPLALAVLAIVVGAGAIWTIQRNRIWQDPVALWSDNIAKAPQKWRPYANLGNTLFERGDYEAAQTNYRKAMENGQKGSSIHYSLGMSALKLNRLEEAAAHLSAAVSVDKSHRTAHEKLGEIFAKLGKTDKAVFHFQQALGLDPTDATAHYNLGTLFAQLGLNTAAIVHFRETVRIDPGHAQALANMALAQSGFLDQAIAAFDQALAHDADLVQVQRNLDETRALKKVLGQRIADLQGAVQANPHDADLFFDLATAYKNIGAVEAALTHCGKALAIRPDFAEALYCLGALHLTVHNHDEALAVYQRLVRLDPANPGVLYNLACIHSWKQQTDKALFYLEQAIDAGYDNATLLRVDPDLENIRGTPAYQRLVPAG